MITELEYMGTWCFPSEPRKLFPGNLKYKSDEGATLILYGFLEGPNDIKEWLNTDIILGITYSGPKITLIGCKQIKKKISLDYPFRITIAFNINYVIIGQHFRKIEDLKFNEIGVNFNNLDEWVNISGFNFEDNDDEIIIKYRAPKTKKVYIDPGWEISLGLKISGPSHSIVQKEGKIEQEVNVIIKSKEPRLFEDCRGVIDIFQDLLSFAVMEPIFPLNIEGKNELGNVTILYKYSDIYLKNNMVYPDDMLFIFGDISENFEEIIKKWFENRIQAKISYDLYFGTLYNPKMYLHHTFLSIIQAIESFHREVYESYEMHPDEHKARITEILDVIPKYREWLEQKLNYSNEPSLRKRLTELYDKYSIILNKYIKNEKKYVNKIISTRNDLIHPDSSHVNKAMQGKELYNIIKYAKLLLEICFLNQMGFSIAEILIFLERNKKYNLILSG